jgi:hypothetical protein
MKRLIAFRTAFLERLHAGVPGSATILVAFKSGRDARAPRREYIRKG